MRSERLHTSWEEDQPTAAETGEARPGALLKERFVLEQVIGRGGMGTVYKARDLRKEEAQDRYPFVAVKVLNEDFRKHADSLKALQREAKKTQALAHPNVASVYDFDRDGPVVFVVMELLEGQSLEQLIQDHAGAGLSRSEVFRIVRNVGAALSYAHHRGVVHSDFKPANAMRAQDGTVKVLDFGIARAIAQASGLDAQPTNFNVTGLRALTPAYASSEMLLGEPAHPSDDVFALACVTYELFTGRHPFGHMPALTAEQRGLRPIPIAGLHRRTWRALAHGLAYTRAERTGSIDQFLAELAAPRRTGLAAGMTTAMLAAAGMAAWLYAPQLRGLDPHATLATLIAWIQSRAGAPTAGRGADAIADRSRDVQQIEPDPQSVAVEQASILPVPQTDPPQVIERSAAPEMRDQHPPAAATANASVRNAGAVADSTPRELTIEQMKRQVISLARIDETPDALTALHELEPRLDPSDEFLQREAPQAISQAYARLSERAYADGNYHAAVALLDRAGEVISSPEAFGERRGQIQRVVNLEELLRAEVTPTADDLENALLEIRRSEGPQYYRIRAHLASVLAARIRQLQATSPAAANELLAVGERVFEGASAMEELEPSEPAQAGASESSLQ